MCKYMCVWKVKLRQMLEEPSGRRGPWCALHLSALLTALCVCVCVCVRERMLPHVKLSLGYCNYVCVFLCDSMYLHVVIHLLCVCCCWYVFLHFTLCVCVSKQSWCKVKETDVPKRARSLLTFPLCNTHIQTRTHTRGWLLFKWYERESERERFLVKEKTRFWSKNTQ